MANRTQTYLSKDWNIWTNKQFNAGRFRLDFSKLDDASAPLGLYDDYLAILDVKINSININQGAQISQGIFSEISPSRLSINMEMRNFTADDSNQFFIGLPIVVTYKNAETLDDFYWGKNTPIFYGRIRSFNVDIQPGTNIASLSVTATTANEDYLNTLIAIDKDTTNYKSTLIYNATSQVIPGPARFNAPSLYHYASTNSEVKTYGEWLSDLNLGDLAIVADDYKFSGFSPSPIRQVIYDTALKFQPNTLGSNVFTYDSTNIIDLTLDWSGAESPSGVTLTNYFNNAIIYQYGSDGRSNSGSFNFSATLDVKELTEMETIGKKMISMSKKFAPIEIVTKTATNFHNLTFKELVYTFGGATNYLYIKPENLSEVGDTIQINMPDYGFINQQMLVTGRTLEITPDDWTTTYNLWKGFTN